MGQPNISGSTARAADAQEIASQFFPAKYELIL